MHEAPSKWRGVLRAGLDRPLDDSQLDPEQRVDQLALMESTRCAEALSAFMETGGFPIADLVQVAGFSGEPWSQASRYELIGRP